MYWCFGQRDSSVIFIADDRASANACSSTSFDDFSSINQPYKDILSYCIKSYLTDWNMVFSLREWNEDYTKKNSFNHEKFIQKKSDSLLNRFGNAKCFFSSSRSLSSWSFDDWVLWLSRDLIITVGKQRRSNEVDRKK